MANEKTKTIPTPERLLLCLKSVRRIVSDLDVDESKLTEEHESLIRRHYDQLLCSINVPDVITQMFQIGKLTARDHEHLRQFQSTPIKASEELLNTIISNSRDVYVCFLESLKKTRQHHVYQMLTSDEGNVCIGGQFVSEHHRLIRQNYDWLTESVDPDSGFLSTLYAKEVLSKREYAQIVCEKDRFIKNEELLSAMSRKTEEDFNKFIVALNETSQGHITKRLTEKPIGSRAKCLEIEQKLKEEQTEKDKYKRIIDELQDKYKSNPVLLHTIRTKIGKNNLLNIFRLPTKRKLRGAKEVTAFLGMTILDKELFVVSADSPDVEIYDSVTFSVSRTRTLKGLINPVDICACKRYKCLYIINANLRTYDLCEIFRIDQNLKLIKKWSTGDGIGCGLSVTGQSNVILTVDGEPEKLKEYSPDGQLVREITLPSFGSTLQSIKMTNGDFVISQYFADSYCLPMEGDYDDLSRVIRVDADGKLKSSSEMSGFRSPMHLVVDANGFVMVVEDNNGSVWLLDSDLKIEREILSGEIQIVRHLMRILLDESTGRLFLASNELISVFEFK